MTYNPDNDPLGVVSDNRGANPSGLYLAQLRNGKHRAGCEGCGWTGTPQAEIPAIDEYVAHECDATDPKRVWR